MYITDICIEHFSVCTRTLFSHHCAAAPAMMFVSHVFNVHINERNVHINEHTHTNSHIYSQAPVQLFP